MKYEKPYKTPEEQADLLISRGLICDKTSLISRLTWINYYRFSGYLYPFRKPETDDFIQGTTFEKVWRRYCFDRKLRLLMLDGIARIEVGIKASIVLLFTQKHGPFGYLEKANLPGITENDYKLLLDTMQKDAGKSREQFVRAFFDKYGDVHSDLPLWMAVELMTFGTMLKFYEGMNSDMQAELADKFQQHQRPFISWLKSLNLVRNICAHHDRLWNRILGIRPVLWPQSERKRIDCPWLNPKVPPERLYAPITIIIWMLNIIAPKSQWKKRVIDLLDEYPEIPKREMGFPENWEASYFWR